MDDKIRALRDWVKDQIGAKSVLGFLAAIASLIPDWQARFVFWKDGLIKMAHQPSFPVFLRLLILAGGIALIVWDHRQRSNKSAHHIRIANIQSAHLFFHADHGYYSLEHPDPHRTHLSHLVEVFNAPASPKKRGKGAGKIRAQLTLNFGKFTYLVSPAAWCGEFFSAVEIEPGETRQMILAVSGASHENMRSWSAVVNRRGNSGEAISTNAFQEIPFLMKGTIIIDLVSCETGNVIASSEVGWAWENQGLTSGPTYVRRLV